MVYNGHAEGVSCTHNFEVETPQLGDGVTKARAGLVLFKVDLSSALSTKILYHSLDEALGYCSVNSSLGVSSPTLVS